MDLESMLDFEIFIMSLDLIYHRPRGLPHYPDPGSTLVAEQLKETTIAMLARKKKEWGIFNTKPKTPTARSSIPNPKSVMSRRVVAVISSSFVSSKRTARMRRKLWENMISAEGTTHQE